MPSGHDNKPYELKLTDFGGRLDSGEDAGPALQRAIAAAARLPGPVRLSLEPGRYDVFAASAAKAVYHISNTASEEENPNSEKTIGILLKGLAGFTLEGNGALLLFHGKMTMLAIDECDNVVIRHLRTDYAQPTVTEMSIEKLDSASIITRVHPDSRYAIEDGRLVWIGEGWSFRDGPMQLYDPQRNDTWRIDNFIGRAESVEELEPGRLRIRCSQLPGLEEGWIIQTRDGIRDQVGALIHRSRNVKLEQASFHFMHGLGIVGQYCDNLSFNRLDMSPRAETGRSVAAFADFVHLSGCKGKISITNSRFMGAHDDAINVHGTHLRIVGNQPPDQLIVRFMHPQTYGFAAFAAGDEIAFIRARSLVPYSVNQVKEAEMINPREMLLTLESPYPDDIEGGDVVENVTWTPEVEITDNFFARIPTRGVLATTRRSIVISRNRFERMRMSAILVADDAVSWYESGRVEDMTITDNRFIECGNRKDAVIALLPENEEVDPEAPVHGGIRIADNLFEISGARVLDAKSVRSLTFARNTVNAVDADGSSAAFVNETDAVRLIACSDVTIESNSFNLLEKREM